MSYTEDITTVIKSKVVLCR